MLVTGGSVTLTNATITRDSDDSAGGDSEVTNLYNAGSILNAQDNAVTVKGADGTLYAQGSSAYTVTVNTYSTTVDLSGAGTLTK